MLIKYFPRIIVIILLLSYACTFAQKGIGVTDLSKDDSIPYDTYVRYLKEKGKPPADYVITKLRKYNIVMIGEHHWLKDHPQFISELIQAVHAEGNSVGLDYLAIEFGHAGDQPLAAEFIESSTYREDLAIRILQNGPDFCGWPYQEVLDIFKTVWEENRKHPENKPIQILLTDNYYRRLRSDGEKFEFLMEQDVGFLTTRDRYMARILERNIIASDRKAIFYCGGGHSEYTIWSYRRDEKTGDCLRYMPAGLLLKHLYPRQIFSIQLLGANMRRAYYPSPNPGEWDRYLDGRMDEIFRRNGNEPVGFDITEPPFSDIREGDFYMFWERGKKGEFKAKYPKCYDKVGDYLADRKISDANDGFIFLKPLALYEGATLCEKFLDDAFLERISKRAEEEITRTKLYELLLEYRPVMGKSLKKLIEKEQ